MNFIFKKIDLDGFIRAWNSDFQDGYEDSHQTSFEDTNELDWKPQFEKKSKIMKEVEFSGETIGYIFLSLRDDGSAHLGYGLYKEFRGKGYSVEMCKQFLNIEVLKLGDRCNRILATALTTNIVSQKVLEKLGFEFIGKVDDPDFDYVRFEKKLNPK